MIQKAVYLSTYAWVKAISQLFKKLTLQRIEVARTCVFKNIVIFNDYYVREKTSVVLSMQFFAYKIR